VRRARASQLSVGTMPSCVRSLASFRRFFPCASEPAWAASRSSATSSRRAPTPCAQRCAGCEGGCR
jgi:hypothetical protein